MNFSLDIEPVKISEVIASIDIHIPYVLNSIETIAIVSFRNKEGIIRKTCRVPINSAEYATWTLSDEYLIDVIVSKLGLSKKYVNKFPDAMLEKCDSEPDWSCPFEWLFQKHDIDHEMVSLNFFK